MSQAAMAWFSSTFPQLHFSAFCHVCMLTGRAGGHVRPANCSCLCETRGEDVRPMEFTNG